MEHFLNKNVKLEQDNKQILNFINKLINDNNDMDIIIKKQEQEKLELEREIERLTYRLKLVEQSLSQRIKVKINYTKAINELQNQYNSLVETSNKLLDAVESESSELEQMMNKTTLTNGDIRNINSETPTKN